MEKEACGLIYSDTFEFKKKKTEKESGPVGKGERILHGTKIFFLLDLDLFKNYFQKALRNLSQN